MFEILDFFIFLYLLEEEEEEEEKRDISIIVQMQWIFQMFQDKNKLCSILFDSFFSALNITNEWSTDNGCF